jgi:hypothetical protein
MSTEKIESWRDLLVWQKAHAGVRRFSQIHRKNKRVPKYAHFLCALCDLSWQKISEVATKDHKERREQPWISADGVAHCIGIALHRNLQDDQCLAPVA